MKTAISAVLIGSILLTGCAGVGNVKMKQETKASASGKIEKGVTTQSQVKQTFGDPYETTYTSNGNQIYKYMYDDASAFNPETVASMIFTLGLVGFKTKGTRKELTILFDDYEKVKTYNISESKIEGGTGIFN
jgi:hypothetical protein